jgi:hypothetical protein
MFQAEQRSAEILDWAIDYRRWLGSTLTIATSNWTAQPTGMSPIVLTESLIDNGHTGITVHGGDSGGIYTLTNTITTAGDETLTYVETIEFYIQP